MKNSDIQQYFIEKGQGEALILLHGNGENCGYFQGQMEAFSKRYHVYAIDTRGHGRTPRGSRPFTIRQFAEDLRYFMDRQRIEKAHLLGFPDGGNSTSGPGRPSDPERGEFIRGRRKAGHPDSD